MAKAGEAFLRVLETAGIASDIQTPVREHR